MGTDKIGRLIGMKKTFNCKQCGNCCRTMAISISHSDMMRWRDEQRVDILLEVSFVRNAPQGQGFYFVKTIRGPVKQPCPFLNSDNLCSIHGTKPVACKDAPDGLEEFKECKYWNKSFINRKRLRKIVARQHMDYKNCVNHFYYLMGLLSEARKYGN